MRKILFRGRRDKRYSKSQDWVYGVPFTDSDGYCIMKNKFAERVVECETVGQFTGLTDKKDNMIFEGDILSANLDDLFPDNETRLVVEWHDNGWYGKNGNMYDDFLNEFNKMFEVIGNIHDNPELIIKEN